MTPLDQFKNFYGINWPETLSQYLNHHYVYCSPTAIGLVAQENDTWWVEYAAGSVEELFCHLPFWLPFISFNSKGRHKQYATARLVNRFLKS